MFKINIHSNVHGYMWLTKETQEEVDVYLQWAAESAHWGRPSWIEEVPEIEQIEIVDEIEVKKTIPAYQIVHPAEYEIIVEDLTAEIEAQKAQIESVRQSQLAAVQRMQSFPQDIDSCQDLDSVKTALKQFVADVAVLLLVK